MGYFDEILDRKSTESIKWNFYDEDVLPMWVADMDFRSPEPVIRALKDRVEQGVFGYAKELPELPELLVERMQRLYGWSITPADIVFLPGVVAGFNLAAHAFAGNGGGVLMQTPVYHPFYGVAGNTGSVQQEMELTRLPDGSYEVDWDQFEAAFDDHTRMFLLCSPHNPIGKVFTREELARMAEICLRRGVVICSDEIHADFIYDGNRHVPAASISPEIAQNTITLMAPSKTFNIAGLECSFAIAQNPELRKKLIAAKMGLVHGANMIGYIAATAAYRDGQPWLDELLGYLQANRDVLVDFVNQQLPGICMWKPQGTYLGWLDCREANLPGKACDFFMQKGRVGLNGGEMFGRGGDGFVRLNFGTPRTLMLEGLERMKKALQER